MKGKSETPERTGDCCCCWPSVCYYRRAVKARPPLAAAAETSAGMARGDMIYNEESGMAPGEYGL